MPTIFDIKRFALHDGPGIRTTVFFKGCPLRCMWCHNPESHSVKPEEHQVMRSLDGKEISMARLYGKVVSVDELLEEILLDQVFYEESGGGVTFSGGEPLMQHRELIDILQLAGQKKIHRAVDTSGYATRKVLTEVAEHTDLFLYDLKNMDPVLHKKYTGVDNDLILENADYLLKLGKEIIFRVPVVPGINDSKQEVDAFYHFFEERKELIRDVHLLPYHKIGTDKYRRLSREYALGEIEEPGEEQIQRIVDKFSINGLNVSVGG